MPLEKGKIDVYFRSGLAGDTDPRVVPVGAFLDIKNAYVDKKGALSKRNGFTRITSRKFDGSTIDNARGLFSTGEELCIATDRRLYARDDGMDRWGDRGSISPATGSTTRYFSDNAKISARNTDCSTAHGYRIYVTSYRISNVRGDSVSPQCQDRLDVRIDSDDGTVAVERVNLKDFGPTDWGSTGTLYSCKASFCDGGLLAACFDGVTGYDVYKFDTLNLPSFSAFTAVPTADIGSPPVGLGLKLRPDMCGHTGASVNGEWSIRYVSSGPDYDFVVKRFDAAFPAPALQATTTFPGLAAGRVYLDGSIADDPVNDRTLVILVWGEAPEPGDLYIDVAAIDNAGGGILWQTTIDTLSGADFIIWDGHGRLVSPETLGVSRGAHEDGDEIVVGAYSVCRYGHSPTFTDGMGDGPWQSSSHLWDAAESHAASVLSSPSAYGHPDYSRLAVGANYVDPGAPVNWATAKNSDMKWMEVRSAAVDATTGVVVNSPVLRSVKNSALISKPFYNGRNVYAWCQTNLNIGFGYETTFCLDLRHDYDDNILIGPPAQPPYVVAVKDVGVSVSTAQGGKSFALTSPDGRASRGAGQSVDRDSKSRAVVAHRIVKSALTYVHGEILGGNDMALGDIEPACIATAMTFAPPVSAATLADGTAVIGGGVVTWYDTERCMEIGYIAPPVFDHFWSNCASSSNINTGPFPLSKWGYIANSNLPLDTVAPSSDFKLTFTYQATWQFTDSAGYLHRSILSPPYQAPTIDPGWSTDWPPTAPSYFLAATHGPNSCLDLNVMFLKSLGATNRGDETIGVGSSGHVPPASMRVYRDFRNNGVFQEVNAADEQLFNGPGYWYHSFVDYGQDLTTATEVPSAAPPPAQNNKLTNPGGKLLYTTSGEIEAVIPEGAKLAVYANDRIWLAGFYRAERLAYSKKITPEGANAQKIAPEFNEAFVLATPAGAAITGLSSMDDKVVAFTRDRVYVVAGDGPDATGQNNTFSGLTLVSSDSGCTDSRSVVAFPGGVLFQSSSGIHLLARNLSVQFIGEAVRDLTLQYPVITSAVAVPAKSQIRFTATTRDGVSGIVIIYDYRVNQWMYWSVTSTISVEVPFVDAVMHNGVYHAIQADGTLWKEDATRWKDDDNTVYYQMNIRTAWLQAAAQSGWQRVYRATALCEQKAPMNLQLSVLNDFNSTTSQIASWDDTAIATFPELPRMQPMVHVKRQQCQAIQLEISDRIPTAGVGATTGEGFTIAGFSLEVGIKRGMVKVSKQQRS